MQLKVKPAAEMTDSSHLERTQQVPLRERVRGLFKGNEVDSFYKKYGITKDEIKEVAKLVEEVSGLKLGAKNGDLKISIMNKREEEKFSEARLLSIIKELGGDKDRGLTVGRVTYSYKELLKRQENEENSMHNAIAFYDFESGKVCLRGEDLIGSLSMELISQKGDWTVQRIGSTVVMTAKKANDSTLKPYVLMTISHELAHQAVFNSNTQFRDDYIKVSAEALKLELEQEAAKEKDKEGIQAKMKAVGDKFIVLGAWNEAIAELTTSRVMEKLGFEPFPMSASYYTQKGIAFLNEVERARGNPIPIVAKNPPNSMQELLTPADYLKRV